MVDRYSSIQGCLFICMRDEGRWFHARECQQPGEQLLFHSQLKAVHSTRSVWGSHQYVRYSWYAPTPLEFIMVDALSLTRSRRSAVTALTYDSVVTYIKLHSLHISIRPVLLGPVRQRTRGRILLGFFVIGGSILQWARSVGVNAVNIWTSNFHYGINNQRVTM